MPDWSNFVLFVIAAFVLLIVPGPAVIYIVARSIDQGRMAGIVSALGVGFGGLFHIAAAALGVSALLLSSALAFNVVKYIGAAYLIYLGIQKFIVKEELNQTEAIRERRLGHIFSQGALVNLLNPKTALFFLAFLPQFINPAKGAAAQILFLGFTFVVMGILSDGMYALMAGTIGNFLKGNVKFLRAQRYFAGSVYLGLGVATALSGSNKSK